MRLIKSDADENEQLLESNIASLYLGIKILKEDFNESGAFFLIQKLEDLIEKPIKARNWQRTKGNIPEMIDWIAEPGPKLLTGYLTAMDTTLDDIIDLEFRIANPTTARYYDEVE